MPVAAPSSTNPRAWKPPAATWPGAYRRRIASAGLTQFGELDEQTSTRWAKRSVKAAPQTFTPDLHRQPRHARVALPPHPGRLEPQTRSSAASFEATPFCQVNGGNAAAQDRDARLHAAGPQMGYQLVLGGVGGGRHPNSFYNLLDLQFDGTTPGYTWSAKGSIFPTSTRLWATGPDPGVRCQGRERSEWSTRLTVARPGRRSAPWSFLLAVYRINAEQTLPGVGRRRPMAASTRPMGRTMPRPQRQRHRAGGDPGDEGGRHRRPN